MRLFLTKLLIFFLLGNLGAQSSNSLLESTLLVKLNQLNRYYSSPTHARRSIPEEIDEFTNDPSLIKFPDSIVSTFASDREDSIKTSPSFENSLREIYQDGDFTEAITYLAENKTNLGLSDGVLLSAMKSIYRVSISESEGNIVNSAPNELIEIILPKVREWNGASEPNWVKSFAQITTEVLMEGNQQNLLGKNAESFAEAIVVHSTANYDGVDSTRRDQNENMKFGNPQDGGWSGFDPSNFTNYQQLAVGLTQGYLNSKISSSDSENSPPLSIEDFADFSDYTKTNENISVLKSATEGLMAGIARKDEEFPPIDLKDSSLYTYDSVKALANGFVLSSIVYATSEPDYLANGLYINAAELVARGIAHVAVSHDTANKGTISASRIAESVAHGSAMGAQLATVLPQSMDYIKNWEIFSQSRRDIAQAVSRGSALGSVDAAASTFSDNSQVVEEVSRGSSLGSMMGTTGLAIYYPTDQIVPIINSTAQGSAYGSLNSSNLSKIKIQSPATEQIESMIARQSAIGSSMGAVFEPTVLLDLSPDTKSNDRKTIDNLSAASFGATLGAIQGARSQEIQNTENLSSEPSSNKNAPIVVIAQSVKQGSTEGALAGAKLALNINENLSVENLNSKGSILKAINTSNAEAASEAASPSIGITSNTNGVPLSRDSNQINSQNMLFLMRKYGVNPKYSSTGAVYKKPSIPLIDEPREDLFSEQPNDDLNGTESYSDKIINASPI